MKKRFKKIFMSSLVATMAITSMISLSGCASKTVSGTFSLKISQNIDSEDYNQEYDEDIANKLYAGRLLGTQTSETDVTLEIKDGKYTLTKEAYMIDHKDDGFDFLLTYKGDYTDNGDGTVTLNVPTSSTRSWCISDLFAETADTFVGKMPKVEYPTKTSAREGLTKDTVTSEEDNTINYFFNTSYVNYSTDEKTGELVEAKPQTITLNKENKTIEPYGTITTYVAQ